MRARLRKTLDANFGISNYLTVVELLIYAANASERENRLRRDEVALTYIDTQILPASDSELVF